MHFKCDPGINPIDTLIDLSPLSLCVGILLGLGTVLSTLPQHFKIIKTKSSAGISGTFLFLANVGQFSVFLSSYVFGIPHLKACFRVGFIRCFPSILALLNLFALFAIYFPITLLFLKYHEGKRDYTLRRSYYFHRFLFYTFLAYAVGISFVCYYLYYWNGHCNQLLLHIAYLCGLVSTVINVLQFLPQIVETFNRKSVGSLSPILFLIQAPGAAIMLVFLIISGENISTWLSYFTSATQQFILLFLLSIYGLRERKQARGDCLLYRSDLLESNVLVNNLVN
ncbi:hypothetical protein GEMRC1_003335 [Eukaryota sp. GEM-RC1]